MAKASILKNHQVVRITNFTNPKYSLEGFLAEFTFDGVKFRHVTKEEFNPQDRKNSSYAYYNEEQFLNYLAKKIDFDKVEMFNAFENAILGDTFYTQGLYLELPTLEFCKVQSASWPYNPNIPVLDEYYNIITAPAGASVNIFNLTVDEVAIDFYNHKKDLFVDTIVSNDEKRQRALIIAKIALDIDRIINDIFSLFSSGIGGFTDYINSQIFEWRYLPIFDNPTANNLNDYFIYINYYYKQTFSNRVVIQDADNNDKFYWLARSLSNDSLKIIPFERKISLLEYLVKYKLSTVREKNLDEQLAVNLVLSFDGTNLEDIDNFLELLISTKLESDGSNYSTLYESVYKSMSTSWLITQSTLTFGNWLFGTNWTPATTKGQFVKAVYRLWVASKYNPYTISTGILKGDSIGIRKKIGNSDFYETDEIDNQGNPELSSIPNKTYYYTLYIGYIIETILTPTPGGGGGFYIHQEFRIIHPDAAPVNINYSSTKTAGFYLDNYSFSFQNDKIISFERVKRINHGGTKWEDVLYGTYSIFQPVNLIDTSSETQMPIPTVDGEDINIAGTNINSLIPIFLLEYIDSAGDRSDIQTALGYTVDGILTFSAVGNLTKLSYLKNLSKIGQVKRAIGLIELASGAVSYILNFIDNCDDSMFCKNLRTFVFWLEIATLSSDVIADQLARRSAKNIINDLEGNAWPINFNDETAKTTIEDLALASDVANDIINTITRINGNFRNKIKRLNGGFDEISFEDALKIPFKTDHLSNADIDIIIRKGLDLKLSEQEIIDFLCVSCRHYPSNKIINVSDLQMYMFNWAIQIKPQGYPYMFNSLPDFISFKNKIKSLLLEFGLPIDDIKIGGSCLYKATPGDIDCYVMMTRDQAIEFTKRIEAFAENSKFVIGARDKNLYKKGWVRKFEENKIIYKRYIVDDQTGKIFMQEAYNTELLSTSMFSINNYDDFNESFEITIKIKGEGIDLLPALNLKF